MAIPQAATASQVGRILEGQHLVRNGQAFSLWARWQGKDGDLKAGEYRLPQGLSVPDLLEELLAGQVELQRITIPEGFTTAQIADLIAEKGLATKDDFYRTVLQGDFDYPFLEAIPRNDRRLEGYLFPDTYQFGRGVDSAALIEMMLARFAQEIAGQHYPVTVEGHELSLHQVITIASMVEREALFETDRPKIAGVIYNRMSIGMQLQIDATVQYALGEFKPRLLYRDLEIDSPYNTYRIPGLPPGPIAMPGSSAIHATLHPVVAGGYCYYLAMPDGHHVFSQTLEEHNINKARYIP